MNYLAFSESNRRALQDLHAEETAPSFLSVVNDISDDCKDNWENKNLLNGFFDEKYGLLVAPPYRNADSELPRRQPESDLEEYSLPQVSQGQNTLQSWYNLVRSVRARTAKQWARYDQQRYQGYTEEELIDCNYLSGYGKTTVDFIRMIDNAIPRHAKDNDVAVKVSAAANRIVFSGPFDDDSSPNHKLTHGDKKVCWRKYLETIFPDIDEDVRRMKQMLDDRLDRQFGRLPEH